MEIIIASAKLLGAMSLAKSHSPSLSAPEFLNPLLRVHLFDRATKLSN